MIFQLDGTQILLTDLLAQTISNDSGIDSQLYCLLRLSTLNDINYKTGPFTRSLITLQLYTNWDQAGIWGKNTLDIKLWWFSSQQKDNSHFQFEAIPRNCTTVIFH